MSNRSTFRFTLPKWKTGPKQVIGNTGDTVWSVVTGSPRSSFGGFSCFDITRSSSKGEVKIDVEVQIGTCSVVSKSDELFLDGEDFKYFDFQDSRNGCSTMTGYVTVHYDLDCTLASKKEATTQTEDNIFLPQLANDLLCLVSNPDSYSDATLVCDTFQLPVHRNILTARSPVFAAMFKTKMQEGRDGIVNIVDIELDALQALMRYVYSGKTDHLTLSMAGDLLSAADKYQLEELKMFCVEKLKASIAADNVFRSVVLGDLHDKSLKAHAVAFICKYQKFSDLEKTDEWQSLLKERPSLAVEVATTIVKYLQD